MRRLCGRVAGDGGAVGGVSGGGGGGDEVAEDKLAVVRGGVARRRGGGGRGRSRGCFCRDGRDGGLVRAAGPAGAGCVEVALVVVAGT